MENQLTNMTPDVTYTSGVVKFENYAAYKQQAEEIAAFVESIVVTPDTVKQAKKLVAETRKIVIGLDKRRIAVRKEILRDFDRFADQVCELKSIVDHADSVVRHQVQTLEEQEREEKKTRIRELWDKRLPQYDLGAVPDLWDTWFDSRYLNKTMSMNKVEGYMTDFLEDTQKDVETIRTLDRAEDVMTAYMAYKSLPEALRVVHEQDMKKAAAQATIASIEPEIPTATFIVRGEKDIKLTELVLKENGIEFERK